MERVGPLSMSLAWVPFLLWMLHLTDSQTPSRAPLPPAPRLSVLPPGQPFSQGQQVWLQCSPPEGRRPAGFLYYRKRAGGWSEPSTLEGSPLEVSTTDLEQEETFACAYWEVTLAGGQAQSEQSNTVQLSVRGPPPTLLLDPQHPVYIQGEQVTLRCLAPPGLEAAEYTFFQERRGQSAERLPSSRTGPFAQLYVEDQPAGVYSCAYRVQLSGRETQSQPSNDVTVAVIGRPPPPGLSISPRHSVYKTGELVTLTCSVPGNRVSKSLFFKDGRQVRQLTPTSALDTSFTYTLYLSPQDGGSYSCRYHTQETTRDVSSLDSSTISFQVLGPLHPPDFVVSPKREVYRTGESILLKCSVPWQPLHGRKFLFFKDQQRLLLPSSLSSKSTFKHRLPLSPLDSGNYSCGYQIAQSRREFQSGRSRFFQVSVLAPLPSATVPTFSTACQAAQGHQTALHDSAATSAASTLPPASSSAGAGVATPTRAPDPTSRTAGSQPSPSQDPPNLTTRSTEKPNVPDSTLTTPQPPGHTSSSTGATSHVILRSSVPNHSDPRGTSQPAPAEHPEGLPLHPGLAIGCGSGVALLLLLGLLGCLSWRKQKGSSRSSARAYWKSMELQRSTRLQGYKDPVGIAITLQERDLQRELTRPASQDWGLLPKSKALASNLGDPLKAKEGEEDADSGAEFEFPEMDPTYMLLGFSCSTFRLEENNPPKEEPHTYSELLL